MPKSISSRKSRPAQTVEQCREAALMILDVTQEQVDASPKIEHLFRGIGGQERVLEYLSGSEEPEARKILELASKLNQRQAKLVPFEAYCIAAGITPKKMFGIISAEVAEQSEKAAALINKASRSEVVEATVNSAKTIHGVKDREMLHKANQFLPMPKNSVTFVKGNQINDRSQTMNVAVLPSLEEGIRRSSNRFNEIITERVKALPAVPDVQDLLEFDEEADGE